MLLTQYDNKVSGMSQNILDLKIQVAKCPKIKRFKEHAKTKSKKKRQISKQFITSPPFQMGNGGDVMKNCRIL